jgi:hypothetical protein
MVAGTADRVVLQFTAYGAACPPYGFSSTESARELRRSVERSRAVRRGLREIECFLARAAEEPPPGKVD